MKLKPHLLSFGIMLAITSAKGQSGNPVPDNVRATNALDAFTTNTVSPGYLLYGIPETPGGITGNVYLSEEWKSASIRVKSNSREFTNVKSRLNLYTNQIEVALKDVVRVIDGAKVESFNWGDSEMVFVNAGSYKFKNETLTGFMQILSEGSIPLLKQTHVIIKRPDYNVQLNVGSKSTRIVKEEMFYYAQGSDLFNAKSLTKKKLLSLFSDSASEIESYMREQSLLPARENDLIKIFQYYNKLNNGRTKS
jgi:hypothetical protein